VTGLKLRLKAELSTLLETCTSEAWGYIFMDTFQSYNSGESGLFILGRSTADAVLAYNEIQGDSRIDTFVHKLLRTHVPHLKNLLKLDDTPQTP
jgi:hypothetical protein